MKYIIAAIEVPNERNFAIKYTHENEHAYKLEPMRKQFSLVIYMSLKK